MSHWILLPLLNHFVDMSKFRWPAKILSNWSIFTRDQWSNGPMVVFFNRPSTFETWQTSTSCPFGCPLQAQEEVSDSLSPLSPAIAVIRSVPREKQGEWVVYPWTEIPVLRDDLCQQYGEGMVYIDATFKARKRWFFGGDKSSVEWKTWGVSPTH